MRVRGSFYILCGTATMIHGGESTTLHAHDGLEIAAGIAHQISNHASTPLEIIVTSHPPSHGDRIDLL
jgi:mannose-6-phosphate isomerase-like protein (cupin superfamily)